MTAAVAQRTIRKGWWIVLARVGDHAAVFVVQVLIARWVGPESFGAFATALLVLTIVDSATEPGIATALVQREEIEREHLDVAWTIAVVRGAMLGAAMVLAAPLLADWVGSPSSAALIRWLAIVPLLRSLSSPALVMLQRALAYRRLALCSAIETAVMFLSTLALIPVLEGPWPLVGGIVLGEAGRVVASYLLAPHRPRSTFRRAHAVELLRYGRWVTGSSIALLVLLYLDDVVVAGVMGASALAIYQVAYRVAGIPASEISLAVGEVSMTAMARMRDQPDRLARSFLRAYELVAAIALPVAAVLAVNADPIVELLLGSAWRDAVPVIQILAAWGVMRALGSLTTSLFRAVGRPDIPARHHWRMVVCAAVLLYPMVELWGLVGAALAVLIPNTFVHFFRYKDVGDVLGMHADAVTGRLVGPAMATIGMVVVMIAAVFATTAWWPGLSIALAGLAGTAVYVAALIALGRIGRCEAFQTARALTIGAV